ncbi:conserved hypothetical protein [Sporisorium reilianum SRZ2]|uniref:Uncharacterized protein n=1 Tax=Sporisorium reilianum (strain SRZ2) TaxID=999809 RepID=E7A289_SPORE|nr:conserved hypothetical protein [Sporisorium reilianum SRZ2]
MMVPTLLVVFLTWSLRVRCAAIDPAAAAEGQDVPPPPTPPTPAPPSSPPVQPTVYTPVVLNQMCQDPLNYCIYVDQNRPGTVRASPVNATDAQGAFLFERAAYMTNPFHVCYGGCCVDLDFTKRPGCVSMRYVSRPASHPGHLLARFADNVDNILGPRDDMRRLLEACPPPDGQALPYAVIGARGGVRPKAAQGDQPHGQQDPNTGVRPVDAAAVPNAEPPSTAPPAAAPAAPVAADPRARAGAQANSRPNHDYFDDVTVPLADGW